MKIILFLVFLVCILVVIKKDTIWMPMSFDDSTCTYTKCFNCEAYLKSGAHESCKSCPFYPNDFIGGKPNEKNNEG